ncbi:hypothetical protein HMPREF6123_1365 [Oribacterium sinus F0268]|uniref:Uncharacterized protein n=1 Tax=Oribacterium sinus F0268 TaxID=585501 RepID=C2KXZ6_9FIRM|nr:hypothetical protein HMPREF6123_1365 [Oribacterium sinus F0268]
MLASLFHSLLSILLLLLSIGFHESFISAFTKASYQDFQYSS